MPEPKREFYVVEVTNQSMTNAGIMNAEADELDLATQRAQEWIDAAKRYGHWAEVRVLRCVAEEVVWEEKV